MTERTLAQVARDQAYDTAMLVAQDLEAIASRIRREANGFSSTNDGRQGERASRIVNEYVQGTGRNGGRLADVVRAAWRADEASVLTRS